MTVALVASLIGVGGAIAAAMISSGDGGSEDSRTRSTRQIGALPEKDIGPVADLAIEAVTVAAGANGSHLISVAGVVRDIGPHEVVYAIAQPDLAPSATQRAPSARSKAATGSKWFVSPPLRPDATGHWSAQIRVVPPAGEPFTVRAVTMPVPSVKKKKAAKRRCPSCKPLPHPEPRESPRESLARLGPKAPTIKARSRPVKAIG